MHHFWKAGVIAAAVVWELGTPPSARSALAEGAGHGGWGERVACLIDTSRASRAEDRACASPDAAACHAPRSSATTWCAAGPPREGAARLACVAGPPSTALPAAR